MKWLALKLIRFYQKFLSLDQGFAGKIIPHGDVCRFQPTCSEYTYQAIDKYGLLKGTWLGLKRIARCHPWGDFGPDPIP